MFGFGLNKRRHHCLILTEDGRIVETALPVVKAYVTDEKTQEAWGLFPDSRVLERKTGKPFLVITERDAAPFPLNGDEKQYRKRLDEAISEIAAENADEALANLSKKSLRNKLADTLRLLIVMFGILITVMIVFGLITAGKLHLPSFG